MTDDGNRTIKSMEQALAYAKGQPVEGTRESWFDERDLQWHSRTFKGGKWVDDTKRA